MPNIGPQDDDKFREFIKTLKEEQVRHWIEVATAIGVSEATVSRWKRLPEARKHLELAIINTIENMESAGKKDWRMWAEKLKMLGVNPMNRAEIKHSLDDPTAKVLEKFGLGDAAKTDKTET